MKNEAARQAASLLAEAWQMGMTLRELPEPCRPRTAAEAYRVQDLLTAELDFPVGGWKIGCTSAVARRLLKARGPFAGRIFASRIFDSGVTLPSAGYRVRGLEGEFAFRLGRDLPPRKRAYGRAEVKTAVAALHPAVEIVDSRYTDWLAVGVASLIADQGVNGALVLGKAVRGWHDLDLRVQPVRMVVNGKTVGEGKGADVLGDPLAALVWLANLMRARGGLAKGQVIATGTCTGLVKAVPGDRIVAEFGRRGRVELAFSA